MKRLSVILVVMLLVVACGQPRARSAKGFDEICSLVAGRGAAEVEKLLGKPDRREALVMSGERWTWWNYTYLDGRNYAPEDRGRVVHLEILFEPEDAGAEETHSQQELRVGGSLGVSYSISRKTM